jgi:type IV secretory pathway VirB9-like protein
MKPLWLIAAVLIVGCAAQPPSPPDPIPAPQPVHHTYMPPNPLDGLSPAIRANLDHPAVIHQGVTTIFPYSPDTQYIIGCRPLRLTSIRLNPDEHIKKHGLSIGDSERWNVEATDQEIRVKPREPPGAKDMTTDLDIATDKRNYLLVLRSRANYSPSVSWYYPDDVRSQLAVYRAALKARAQEPAQ